MDAELAARCRALGAIAFDFDGVFTDNTVYVSQDGTESVRCWRSDGLGLQKLRNLGVEMVILSTEVNPVVTARAKKLKLRCIQGLEDKRAALEKWAAELGVELLRVAFVGNDINDAGCLKAAGLPFVVADAHSDVVALGRYQTRAPGGRGAVREVCDLIAGAKS